MLLILYWVNDELNLPVFVFVMDTTCGGVKVQLWQVGLTKIDYKCGRLLVIVIVIVDFVMNAVAMVSLSESDLVSMSRTQLAAPCRRSERIVFPTWYLDAVTTIRRYRTMAKIRFWCWT